MLLYKNNMPNCVFWLIFDAIRRCFRAVFEQNLNVGFLRFKILYNQHNGYPHKRWNVKNILQIKLRNEELVITFNFALKEGSWYRALRVLPRCVLINSAVVCKPWNSLSLKAEPADWLSPPRPECHLAWLYYLMFDICWWHSGPWGGGGRPHFCNNKKTCSSRL